MSWRFVAVATLAACSNTAGPSPASPSGAPMHGSSASPAVLEPGAVPPSSRPVRASAGSVAPPPPTVPLAPVHVRLTRVAVAEGEDGAGNTVPATHPIAIDLETAHGWPAGALATTLYVGAMHFHEMGYPTATTMRFIATDANALPMNAEVVLHVGPSAERRRVIAPALPPLP